MEMPSPSLEVSIVKPTIEIQSSENGKMGSISAITGLLRKAICAHQGSVIEHIYWGAELHKKLRLICESDGPDSKAAISALKEIDYDLPDIFKNAWLLTVYHLRSYFSLTHKSRIIPRMCIKSTRSIDGEKHITDLFREDGGASCVTYKISKNTGFQKVEDSGKYYRCNNIPAAAKGNDYINPRLNAAAAKMYNPSRVDRAKRFIKKQEIDKSWCNCWIDFIAESGNEMSCYKSTLIVPLTLINNHQSGEFINNTMIGASKDSRNIYGFLCFDHPALDYFTDDDINIGYVFADLLSFYVITELNFTTFSQTYEEVSRLHRSHK